ncbi:hypothetical protein [Psychrobacillus vulpis]|uniref:hypothetical protein n=1 Tax=Psychrobacillus vulpis TaxID=2325572 RepID=UPI001408E33E|nr:hypothetical protein [Psychrobacillus vulpis]
MSTDLVALFPSIELLSKCPVVNESYIYIFHNENSNCWMTINKNEVSDREYTLLSSVFPEVKQTIPWASAEPPPALRFVRCS